jgi:hypothetical protein
LFGVFKFALFSIQNEEITLLETAGMVVGVVPTVPE